MKNVFKDTSLIPKSTQKQLSFPSGNKGLDIGRHMFSGNSFVIDESIKEIDFKENLKVCDVGCGPGYSLNRLAHQMSTGEIVGVDPSREMCDMAAENNQELIDAGLVNIKNEKTPNLSLEDNYFDYVLLNNVIYFWKRDELNEHLNELARIIKKDGYLIIYMTDKEYLKQRTGEKNGIFNKYTTEFVSTQLQRIGFTEEKTKKIDRENGENGWILKFRKNSS